MCEGNVKILKLKPQVNFPIFTNKNICWLHN